MSEDSLIRIWRVAVAVPIRRTFYYLPAPGYEQQPLPPGIRLKVPFGKRTELGILIDQLDQPASEQYSSAANYQLKPVSGLIDKQPVLPPELLKLGHWAAQYYLHPLGDALAQMLPGLLRDMAAARHPQETHWRLNSTDRGANDLSKALAGLQRAPKQQALLQLLAKHDAGMGQPALQALGFSLAQIRALEAKQLIEKFTTDLPNHRPQISPFSREPAPQANAAQQQAIERISQQTGFQGFLLFGVTGSGKTEVYLQVIQQHLANDRQVLVLVPEIGLTPQTLARFSQRLHSQVVSYHSGLSDRQRLDNWLDIASGKARVIVGTRSAVFMPLPELGLIIVDEEQDSSFKQQEGFRYSARDVAVMRAKQANIPIILGSATPALDSLFNAHLKRYQRLNLATRATGHTAPKIELFDLRNQAMQDGLSERLLTTIAEHLSQRQQVMVFINRRGFAPSLTCRHCGWVSDCPRCDVRMTYHQTTSGGSEGSKLHCHHCDLQKPVPERCPNCNSQHLEAQGTGTQRIEETLRQRFVDTPILRVDRDNIRNKQQLERWLQQVHSDAPCILVGTQMLAKGHHFPHLSLVAIVNADAGLFSSDFKAVEQMAQLLIQVAGRAGRGKVAGQVILETHHPQHPLLQCLAEQGYEAFANQALEVRQQTKLPPFGHYALWKASAVQPKPAIDFLEPLVTRARQQIGEAGWQIQVLGPLPHALERKAGRHYYQIHFNAARRTELHQLLPALIEFAQQQRKPASVRWSIDIDPLEIS